MGLQSVHVAVFFRLHGVRTRLDVLCWSELFALSVDDAIDGTGMFLLYATLEGFLQAGLELAGFLGLGTGHFIVVVVDGGRYFGRFGVQIEHTSVVAG